MNDIWWTTFTPGTTYRIAFSSNGCAALSVQGKAGLRRSFECNGYMTFTPGPEDGGRYVFEVTAPARVGSASYRLRVLPATADDVGVGLGLENLATARGTLAPSAGDVVDLYHFDVTSLSDVRLRLAAGGGASVTLLNYGGGQLGSSSGEVDRKLGPGHYVAAVRGSLGAGRSGYRLSLDRPPRHAYVTVGRSGTDRTGRIGGLRRRDRSAAERRARAAQNRPLRLARRLALLPDDQPLGRRRDGVLETAGAGPLARPRVVPRHGRVQPEHERLRERARREASRGRGVSLLRPAGIRFKVGIAASST